MGASFKPKALSVFTGVLMLCSSNILAQQPQTMKADQIFYSTVPMPLAAILEYVRTKGPISAEVEGSEQGAYGRKHGSAMLPRAEAWPLGKIGSNGCRRVMLKVLSPGSRVEHSNGRRSDFSSHTAMDVCQPTK